MASSWQLELPERLQGARVSLRAPKRDDAGALLEAALESVETVGRWSNWLHQHYALADAEGFIDQCRVGRRRRDRFEYLVLDEVGHLVGSCGLNHLNRIHRLANLGYWMRLTAEGRGYASEAARVLAVEALHCGLIRIEIVIDPENHASRRVAEKLGARREALLRHRILLCGEPRDAILFSLVGADLA